MQHARAKEDHLRRIGEIEKKINRVAQEELMLFQSRHPNKTAIVSGRTGMTVVFASSLATLLMLVLCLALFSREVNLSGQLMYFLYIVAVGFDVIAGAVWLGKYSYSELRDSE